MLHAHEYANTSTADLFETGNVKVGLDVTIAAAVLGSIDIVFGEVDR